MTKAPIRGTYWVLEDRLLAGEYPSASREDDARRKLAALLEAGIRSFVDLTDTEDPLRPYDALVATLALEGGIDVRYRRMGIQDRDVPTREHMSRVLDHIHAEMAARRPVYVHCFGGIGRTGTVVGCWLVQHEGHDGDTALTRIGELRQDVPDRHWRSPETDGQRDFVARWRQSDDASRTQ
jgi:predicted protein tyrosine phosphatase